MQGEMDGDGIDGGHKSLGRRFLVTGRAVDLAGKP